MKARRRQRCCDRTDCQRCEVRTVSHARRQTTRVHISVSVDVAKIIAALAALMLMFFH